MTLLVYLIAAAAAYLAGSIPTGYLVGKARGVDIRKVGSGNIGATNVLRTLGKPIGIAVLLVDCAKGTVGCGLVPWGLVALGWGTPEQLEALRITAGVAAILGHNYTCWLNFRGGKGIATSAGVLAVLLPVPLLACLGVWLLLFAVTRYVSVASIGGAISLPIATAVSGSSGTLVAVAAVLGLLATYKHKGNIQRLLAGTEPRFGKRTSQTSEPTKL